MILFPAASMGVESPSLVVELPNLAPASEPRARARAAAARPTLRAVPPQRTQHPAAARARHLPQRLRPRNLHEPRDLHHPRQATTPPIRSEGQDQEGGARRRGGVHLRQETRNVPTSRAIAVPRPRPEGHR